MLHQTIIGLEAKKQLEVAGEKLPDIVVGCAGGGSNFAGLAFPFTLEKINGADMKIIPTEPTACPTMTRAPFHYDFGDTACTTPLLAMYTLGHAFIPPFRTIFPPRPALGGANTKIFSKNLFFYLICIRMPIHFFYPAE